MARFDQGGGGQSAFGGASSMFGGMQNIAKAAVAPRRNNAPAPTRVANQARSAVSNIGRSVARSSTPSRNTSNNYRAPARNTYRAPTVSRPVAPRPPVGNTPTGVVAKSVPPPPPPQPISIDDYLAKDTAYNSQKNAYQKALADYAAQMQGEQSKYNGEYDAQLKQLGLDRTEGQKSLQDDYASRGLLQSGVYADALGQFNQKFDTSQADLERAKQAYMSDLTTGQTNFQQTQQTLLEKARQDALNRRLDSLKV